MRLPSQHCLWFARMQGCPAAARRLHLLSAVQGLLRVDASTLWPAVVRPRKPPAAIHLTRIRKRRLPAPFPRPAFPDQHSAAVAILCSNEAKHMERFAVRSKVMTLRPDGGCTCDLRR